MNHERTHAMAHHDPILVGVDGSEASAAAVRYGVQEARRLGCAIHLVHVPPIELSFTAELPMMTLDLAPVGRQILDDAAQVARAALPERRITTSLGEGPCVHVIEKAAERAALLVLGGDSRSTLERLVTGSKTAALASSVGCSVVVVPTGWTPRATQDCVVVGIKSTSHSAALLPRALRAASDRRARLVVVHAWKLPSAYEDVIAGRVDQEEWTALAKRSIEQDIATWRRGYADVPVDIQVVHGQAARVLQAASEKADLLLLARSDNGFPLGHLGGVGRALLRESLCPVEVVPASDETYDTTDSVLERSAVTQR